MCGRHCTVHALKVIFYLLKYYKCVFVCSYRYLKLYPETLVGYLKPT